HWTIQETAVAIDGDGEALYIDRDIAEEAFYDVHNRLIRVGMRRVDVDDRDAGCAGGKQLPRRLVDGERTAATRRAGRRWQRNGRRSAWIVRGQRRIERPQCALAV